MTLVSILRWAVELVYFRLLLGAGLTFKKSTRAGLGSLPMVATFWILMVQVQRAQPFLPLAIPGAAFLVGSLVLFQWASNSVRGKFFSYIGDSDTPQFVFQGGPFAYIRNPFYTSYMLANIAVAVMYPNWITAATTLAAFAIFWRAAAYEERKFDKSPCAAEYRAYLTRTGRFFPKL